MVNELRSRIREQFAALGKKGDVRILCELLEMTDVKWQNAVEGYLNTQRFYLLVEPGDFDIALSVYEKMRRAGKGTYIVTPSTVPTKRKSAP